jgi:hypothetical protein
MAVPAIVEKRGQGVRLLVIVVVIVVLIVLVALVLGLSNHNGSPRPNGMSSMTVVSLQR